MGNAFILNRFKQAQKSLFCAFYFVFFGVVITVNILPTPLFAQTQKAPQENMDERAQPNAALATLAATYYDLNPVWKSVSLAIRGQARNADMTQNQRLAYITAMENLIDKAALRDQSIAEITRLFTVDELRALIKFYQDPAIKSAQAKQETFDRSLAPFVAKMIDKAYLDYKLNNNN